MTLYTNLEHRFLTTKPILGRAEDVRPIGQRRRTWERVVRGVDTATKDGEVVYWYGAHLYQTTVIKAFTNGEVELNCNGWATPSTAEFMSAYLPMRWYVTKQSRNLWLNLRGDDNKQYLIPKGQPVRFKFLSDGGWEPLTPLVLTQKVVDKAKMHEARDLIRPFLDFTTTMLKLSDGWVMSETLHEYHATDRAGWVRYHDYKLPEGMSAIIQGKGRVWGSKDKERDTRAFIEFIQTSDTDTWQRVMYQVLEHIQPFEKRVVRQEEVEMGDTFKHQYTVYIYDHRYTVSAFLKYIDAILKQLDVFTTRTVDGNKIRNNLLT